MPRACASCSTRWKTSTTCRTSTPPRWSTENPGHRPGLAGHRVRHRRIQQQQASVCGERVRQIRRRRPRHAAQSHPRGPEPGHRRACAGPGRGREGVRQRQSAVDARARAGARHRNLRRGPRRPAGGRIHRAAGQAIGGRQRARRQGAGAAHGETPAFAPRRPGARCGRCAGLRDLPCARQPPGDPFRLAHEERASRLIGRLSGKLAGKQPPQVLIDVGGVAYELDVPMSTFYSLPATGEAVSLYTHLVVREDAHTLYGFATLEERSVFRQPIRISGVGARTALSVLSGMSVADLSHAITMQEAAPLTRIPGIGKKTAERLLLELKGKLAEAAGGAGEGASDVVTALVALGYSDKEALAAAKGLAPGLPVTEAIRAALKTLAKG